MASRRPVTKQISHPPLSWHDLKSLIGLESYLSFLFSCLLSFLFFCTTHGWRLGEKATGGLRDRWLIEGRGRSVGRGPGGGAERTIAGRNAGCFRGVAQGKDRGEKNNSGGKVVVAGIESISRTTGESRVGHHRWASVPTGQFSRRNNNNIMRIIAIIFMRRTTRFLPFSQE